MASLAIPTIKIKKRNTNFNFNLQIINLQQVTATLTMNIHIYHSIVNNSNCTFYIDDIEIREEYDMEMCWVDDYSAYRYGFNQGSEKDDEIKGAGNSYTTHFRQLDPRLGRWLTIDPKMSAWESPYVSMGNTPIWANDPMGDKFKKLKHKEKLEKKITERKREIKDNISDIEKRIASAEITIDQLSYEGGESTDGIIGKDIQSLKSQIGELKTELDEQKWMLGQMNTALDEIGLMEKSEVLFVTRRNIFKRNTGGTYAKSSKKVIIGYGNFNSQIHEFKHGFQYLKGELSFGKNSLSGSGLYDASDEQFAYQRDYAFNPKQKLYTSQGVNNHKKITAGALYREYSNRNITIARGERSLNTYKGDLSDQFVVEDSNLIK